MADAATVIGDPNQTFDESAPILPLKFLAVEEMHVIPEANLLAPYPAQIPQALGKNIAPASSKIFIIPLASALS